MAPISQQIAEMAEMLPVDDQMFALEFMKKLVLAWDPDFTKATPAEDAAMAEAIREMEAGEYVPFSEVNRA